MKKLIAILGFIFLTHLSFAYEFRNIFVLRQGYSNRVIWTVWEDYDVIGYIVERNGVPVGYEPSGQFMSAAYVFDDQFPLYYSEYRIRTMMIDGTSELSEPFLLRGKYPSWWEMYKWMWGY